jgi:hypothetical protein
MENLTWTHLATLAAFVGLGLTIWRMRVSDLNRLDDKREALSNDFFKALAQLRKDAFEELGRQAIGLSVFKLSVSQDHPTIKDMSDSEDRLTKAMDKLTDRIDRWLERQQP